MAKTFSKTLMITRVTYKTVEVRDGVPEFVDHPDAVFSGLLDQEKAERLLKAQLGKDSIPVITKVDAGQHRYEMDLATFVLNARIADGEPEEDSASNAAPDSTSTDSDPVPDAAAEPAAETGSAPTSAVESVPAPEPAPAPTAQVSDGSNDEDDVEL